MTANLTDEQKTSLQWLDDLCTPHMYLDRLGPVRDLVKQLLSARPAESWQVEINAYKREVRELEAMLRIPDDAKEKRLTAGQILAIWDHLEWKDLNPLAVDYYSSLMLRFAREIESAVRGVPRPSKKTGTPADIDHAK